MSSPLVVCGTVFVAAADGRVYAFNAANGHRLWRTSAIGSRFFGAAISHGMLFAVTNGVLYAFATKTGELLWSKSVSTLMGGAPTPPLVAGSVLYVVDAGVLIALDARSGAVRWSVPAGQSTFLSVPALANGLIYVGVDQSLATFDANTGAPRWSGTTGDVVWSTPTISGGSAFVGSSDHNVCAFDATTGGCGGLRRRATGCTHRRRSLQAETSTSAHSTIVYTRSTQRLVLQNGPSARDRL